MKSYVVQSGPLKITIVAESAQQAALEAIRWSEAWERLLREKTCSNN